MSSVNIEKATASELHAQKAPYSSVSNSTVERIKNPDALAIWTYLQTRAPGWKVIGSHLQDHFDMGRVRYRKAMACLKDLGLITHQTTRNESGQMLGKRIIVHYQPKVQEPVCSESPKVQETERSESAKVAETTPYVINQDNNKQSNVDEIKGDRENAAGKIGSLDFTSWPELPSKQVLSDYKKTRKAALTQTAVDRMAKELHLAFNSGHSVDDCLSECCERGWRGFKFEWLINARGGHRAGGVNRQEALEARNAQTLGEWAEEG
ncbi:hypothetical protein [Litorivivens sp.]|uniref:hypothetical protein n=1 Tax=Litorivivens sp. TaxID=2020868 RepID=UPI003561E224